MEYVLIVIWLSSTNLPGIELSMQEFSTKDRCEKTKAVIIETSLLVTQRRSDLMKTVCIEK